MAAGTDVSIQLLPRSKKDAWHYFVLVAGITLTVFLTNWIPVILFYTSLILHETGHYIAYRWHDIPVKEVHFSPVGGHVIALQKNRLPPKQNLHVSLAGPLLGLLPLVALPTLLPLLSALGVVFSVLLVGQTLVQLVPLYQRSDGWHAMNAASMLVRGQPLSNTGIFASKWWDRAIIAIFMVLCFLLGFLAPQLL